MNFQKLLLVFIPFSVILFKCFFKNFVRNDTHMFLCFLYASIFSLEGFRIILFFNLPLVQKTFRNSLVTKEEWLPLQFFFFKESCLFTTLIIFLRLLNNCFQNFPQLVQSPQKMVWRTLISSCYKQLIDSLTK